MLELIAQKLYKYLNNKMGKLSIDMIIKSVPGQNKRRADESISHYLNRLTHIYVQDKIITEIVSTFRLLA